MISLTEAVVASVVYIAGIMVYIRHMSKRAATAMITEIEQHLIDEGFLRGE